jgi:Galactose-1-phosphate uridylyltransferase
MQQLRRDPIIGRWIIVNYNQVNQPSDYQSESVEKKRVGKLCPFCSGNEDKTPPGDLCRPAGARARERAALEPAGDCQ